MELPFVKCDSDPDFKRLVVYRVLAWLAFEFEHKPVLPVVRPVGGFPRRLVDVGFGRLEPVCRLAMVGNKHDLTTKGYFHVPDR